MLTNNFKTLSVIVHQDIKFGWNTVLKAPASWWPLLPWKTPASCSLSFMDLPWREEVEEPQVQTLKGSGGGIIPAKLSLLLQTAPL